MRILLVEDDPEIGQSIALMLQSSDYDYDWVKRGEEAVAMALNVEYDVILLDVMLPGMDGYEVLQQLKAAEIDTPVILQSALVEREEAVKGFSLGVADYLIKPFNRAQLAVRIDLTLERAQAAREESDREAVVVEREAKLAAKRGPNESSGPDEAQIERRQGERREGERRQSERRQEAAASMVEEAAGGVAGSAVAEVTLAPAHKNRRGSERSNVLRGGKIVYRAATCTMDCVILNLSDEGAALQPADTPHCPDVFTLKIQHGKSYRCEVCWRYRNKLGVRFV